MSKGFEHNVLNFGSIYNLYLFSYTRIVDLTWRVPDCEELVGKIIQEMTWAGHSIKKPQSMSKIVPPYDSSGSATEI